MGDKPDEQATYADIFMAALLDAAQPGDIAVPGHTILGELSRGGMGAVYHAEQHRPKREVALKVLLPHLAEEPEMLARFQLEARAMAALDHPGILPVYEVGDADGTPYFSMKLATGGTLAHKLDDGPLPPREAAVLIVQLARAVHHAHQHGVLHRDLKPGNFLFLEDGRACVTDFGLAKLTVSDQRPLTRTESFFGTPHYMPPEVAAGSAGDSTVAGDLYSMGAVFYECLTGRRPHESKESITALLRAIADEPIKPPVEFDHGVPRDLSVICMKALERKPSDRYTSLADFADDVERWLEGRPIKARPVGMLESAWRWAARHPLSAGLIVALVTVILAGAVLQTIALRDARQKLQRSLIEQARNERLLGTAGHRETAMDKLKEAASIGRVPEIRDEAAALLARPDVSEMALFGNTANKPWPYAMLADDKMVSWKVDAHGSCGLAAYASGTVRLWRKNKPESAAEWMPDDGSGVVGDFSPSGDFLILAGTESGVIVVKPSAPNGPRVLLPPSPVIRFLTVSPDGSKVALARVDGLQVMDVNQPDVTWHYGDSQSRCAPAWSADGLRVVVAMGDRREAIVLAAGDGAVCTTVPVSGVPQQLAFHPDGGQIAVATDDGLIHVCEAATGATWTTLRSIASALSFSDDGKKLIATTDDGSTREWLVFMPLSFHEWPEAPRAKADGAVLNMSLSPNGTHLLTISTGCLAVWSVLDQRQTGFHPLENQRIDVKASAWWLDDRSILLQVPGGLERLELDAKGIPGPSIRLPRVAGSTVLDVRKEGWIVALLDEDGNKTIECWPGGKPEMAKPADFKEEGGSGGRTSAGGCVAALAADGVIEATFPGGSGMRLVPPQGTSVGLMTFDKGGKKLLLLTKTHRVFSWDLDALSAALDAKGL